MHAMTYIDNLYVISKVSPRFPYGLPSQEYIVSEDCFYPLIDLDDDLDYFNSFPTNNVCDTQYTENNFLITSDDQDEMQNNSVPCSCVQSVEFMKILNRIEIAIDAILFSLVMIELNQSKSFRRNVLLNFYKLYINKKKRGISNRTCLTCNRRAVKIHAIVFLNLPKQNVLDYKWYPLQKLTNFTLGSKQLFAMVDFYRIQRKKTLFAIRFIRIYLFASIFSLKDSLGSFQEV